MIGKLRTTKIRKAEQRNRPSRAKPARTPCYAPKLLEEICDLIQSDVALAVKDAMVKGDHASIVGLSIDPSNYMTAWDFKRDYLISELMSKYPNWDIGVDRELVALAKFIDSEVACSETNESFDSRVQGTKINGISASAILLVAARKITRLLGDFDVEEFEASLEWGPGAAVGIPRRTSDAYYKFGTRPTASHNMAPLATTLQKWFSESRWRFEPSFVAGSHGTTVPKNAKTDRFIAIEPSLNLFCQKSIGKMMRRRLQKVGLLTAQAQRVNAEMARRGSIDGSLATIDLSSASDSIALVLLRLLPQDWVDWIEYTRSPVCVLPTLGLQVDLAKVSSMGNGYTFELETLLFWALTTAVVELLGENGNQCTVYGDDIICPTEAAPTVIAVLQLCGFVTNSKKTFTKGPFRESCGKHWFAGTDVTPFYVRQPVDTIDRWYWLANSIREWASVDGCSESWVKPIYDLVVGNLPERRVLPVPVCAGKTAGLIVDLDEALTFTGVRFCKDRQAFRYRFLSTETLTKDFGDYQRQTKSLYLLEKKWGRRDPDEEVFITTVGRKLGSAVIRRLHGQILHSIRGAENIGLVPRGNKSRVSTGVSSGWCGYGPWV